MSSKSKEQRYARELQKAYPVVPYSQILRLVKEASAQQSWPDPAQETARSQVARLEASKKGLKSSDG